MNIHLFISLNLLFKKRAKIFILLINEETILKKTLFKQLKEAEHLQYFVESAYCSLRLP